MPALTHPRPPQQRLWRAAIFLVLTASVLYAAIGTFHWPIVGDAPLLHYNVFLHDHGFTPYRDIHDMDFPGTYVLEGLAIHALGPGPIAWRFFDYLLLAIIGASMIAIALPADWLAGYFAACLFALIHFRDGPTHTGQRDLMLTAMLLPAIAFLLHSTRGLQNFSPGSAQNLSSRSTKVLSSRNAAERSASLPIPPTTPLPTPYSLFAIPFLLTSFATLIKPTGLLFFLTLLTLLWIHLGKLHRPRFAALAIAKSAFWLPIILTAIYLHHIHALHAFLTTLHTLDAYHATLGRPSLFALILGSIPAVLLIPELTALPLFLVSLWPSKHRNLSPIPYPLSPIPLLLAATALGCLSYILQGKGYPYHRYPTEAFLLLYLALLVFPYLQSQTWHRIPAALCVLASTFYLAPSAALIAIHYDRTQEFNDLLATDLTHLKTLSTLGPDLNHKIQCIDTTAGCIATLYNERLVQSTGYLYDCYLFQPTPAPFREQYRADFFAALQQSNPQLLVISNQECFTFNRTFDFLDRWPQFTTYLQANYTQIIQRTPPHTIGWWRHPNQPFSYRIYLRKPQ